MPTLPNRLRQAAQYTGLDGLRELLIEAAGELENSDPRLLYDAVYTLCSQAGTDVDETVDWLCGEHSGMFKLFDAYFSPNPSVQQPQERKPLTHDEALKLIEMVGGTDETMDYDHMALVRAIEDAHGIKD